MLEFFLILFLLFCNGFFVAAEFGLVRVRASQLEILRDDGSRAAERTLAILAKIDAYLSAVQLGITFASLGLGWLAEPAINTHINDFFTWLALPVREDITQGISFLTAFFLLSFFHIVIGEIAPKSIAIAKPLEVSLAVSLPMQIFYLVFAPVLTLLTGSSNLILKMFNIKPVEAGHAMGITAEELRNIALHSGADGTITQEESSLVGKVFKYSQLLAKEIMIPRGKIDALPIELTVEEALTKALTEGHSRYPVYRDTLDEIVGLVHLKDLAAAHLARKKELEPILRQMSYVPEIMSVARLVRTLQEQRSHLAIVVDEYGGTSGIVTIEDALEELVGEIEDEFDELRPQSITAKGKGYIVDGSVLLSDLREFLSCKPFDDAECDTVGGFVMQQLGRIAAVGDEINTEDISIRVVAMDKMHINTVFVTVIDINKESADLKGGVS